VSLSSSLVVASLVVVFFFFSLSLSRVAGFVCPIFFDWEAVGVVLESLMDCQRPTEVNTKAFSQTGAVTFYWSPSIRRRIGTPLVF
jgi:hypothetical protein